MDHQHILDEQMTYYRKRAQEYDETTGQTEEVQRAFARARELLQHHAPVEQMLELACGTGTWTRALLPLGHELTAIDASPEMLSLARQKVGKFVQFQQADLFQWQPSQQYDFVFFANWLSHVPPPRLDAFLDTVARAVRPGGSLAMVDQYAPLPEDREISVRDAEEGAIYANRSLLGGQTFTIVKVFYDLQLIEHRLDALGFRVTVQKLGDIFFFLEAWRTSAA